MRWSYAHRARRWILAALCCLLAGCIDGDPNHPADAGVGLIDGGPGDGAIGDRPPTLPPDADWLLTPVIPYSGPMERVCPSVPGTDPTIAPPRPIGPTSRTRVTSLRPTLQWELPPGVRSVRVELCEDDCCRRPILTLDVEGDRVRPTEPLRMGARVWWRVRGRSGTRLGARTGATWLFDVPYRDSPIDSFGGRIRDFDGDGYSDLIGYGLQDVRAQRTRTMLLYRGGPTGLRQENPRVTPLTRESTFPLKIADFNGDGIGDVLQVETNDRSFFVLFGARDALRRSATIEIANRPGGFCNRLLGAFPFDVDSDGFSDVVAEIGGYFDQYCRCAFPTYVGLGIVVFRGSARGIEIQPSIRFDVRIDSTQSFYASLGIGDMDGDGCDDLLGRAILAGHPGLGVLFRRDMTPIVTAPSVFIPPADPRHLEGSLGFDGTTVGDVDGDRRQDFALGGGVIYVLSTRVGLTTPRVYRDPLRQFVTLASGTSAFGLFLNLGGDLNGDGYFDLLIGSPGSTDTINRNYQRTYVGRGFVYFGGAAGPASDPSRVIERVNLPAEDAPGATTFDGYAIALIGMGDLNHDGFDDAILVDDREIVGGLGACVVWGGVGELRTDVSRCLAPPEFRGSRNYD